ncbi:hypothetical protein K4K59_007724 [Colletotrichum sp. SAR11_240]|nr:hypothetical protein K4K59_007724 [Colletotrichum sp. SAR11_240]
MDRPGRPKTEFLFLVICLLSVNIFRPYDFDRHSYDLLNYKVSFVIGQVLSLATLSRLPLNLVFPYIFVAKGQFASHNEATVS